MRAWSLAGRRARRGRPCSRRPAPRPRPRRLPCAGRPGPTDEPGAASRRSTTAVDRGPAPRAAPPGAARRRARSRPPAASASAAARCAFVFATAALSATGSASASCASASCAAAAATRRRPSRPTRGGAATVACARLDRRGGLRARDGRAAALREERVLARELGAARDAPRARRPRRRRPRAARSAVADRELALEARDLAAQLDALLEQALRLREVGLDLGEVRPRRARPGAPAVSATDSSSTLRRRATTVFPASTSWPSTHVESSRRRRRRSGRTTDGEGVGLEPARRLDGRGASRPAPSRRAPAPS